MGSRSVAITILAPLSENFVGGDAGYAFVK